MALKHAYTGKYGGRARGNRPSMEERQGVVLIMQILAKTPNMAKTRSIIGDTIYELSQTRDDIWIITPDII